ncbi:hypothetical protein HY251_03385, partial [bacterium]|nr:hypothetical protein [bacterium]
AAAGALAVLGQRELLLAYVPLYAIVIAFLVVREEEALAERYGADHAAYRARVPGFFPRPWRRLARAERHGSFSWRPIASGLELWKLLGIAAVFAFFLARRLA